MASAAIIRNIALEGPGSIAQILRDASLSMRIYDASSDIASLDLEETAALVVLGGPMNVYEEEKYPFLTGEVRLLRRALGRDMPILGICLGAQLLAKTAGGRVELSPEPEIGYFPVTLTAAGRADDLFRDMPPEFPVFQWHYDMFQVPPGAELLARSGRCPHQAFRLGRAAYGLQFHFEVTPEMVEAWLNEYNPQEVSPAAILSQAGAYADEMQGYAHTLCRNFLSLCRQQ